MVRIIRFYPLPEPCVPCPAPFFHLYKIFILYPIILIYSLRVEQYFRATYLLNISQPEYSLRMGWKRDNAMEVYEEID